MTQEQKDLAAAIIAANNGRAAYNLTKAAKIAGRSRSTFSRWLYERGVTVQRSGKDKYVNANDLAVAMTFDKKSPV